MSLSVLHSIAAQCPCALRVVASFIHSPRHHQYKIVINFFYAHTQTHARIYSWRAGVHTHTPGATLHTATHSPHGTVLCLSVAAKKRPSRGGIPRGVRTVPRCSCSGTLLQHIATCVLHGNILLGMQMCQLYLQYFHTFRHLLP